MSGEFLLSASLLIAGTVVSTGLIIHLWHSASPGAGTMRLSLTLASWWCVAYVFEISSITASSAILWAKLEYISIATISVSWFTFASEYTGNTRWLKPGWRFLLYLLPVIILALVATNESHGLIWNQVAFNTSRKPFLLDLGHGVAFWFLWAYSYLFNILATVILLRFAMRSATLYRKQAFFLSLGILAPWAGNFFYVINWTQLDFTPLAFIVGAALVTWGVYRYRLLDIIPVAHNRVFSGMKDPALVLDQEFRIVDLNLAAVKLFGESIDKALGKSFFSLLPDLERSLLPKATRLPQEKQAGIGIHQEFVWATGDIQRDFDLHLSPLLNAQKRLGGSLVVLHDITAMKAIENELAQARDQAERARDTKSQILAHVSHDLRTPLSAILGYSEMLREGVMGKVSEEQIDLLNRILVNIYQMNFFINDLLDQAVIEKGALILRESAFSPADLLGDLRLAVEPYSVIKGITISFLIDAELPNRLIGDARRIQQILVNLVNSVLRYTERGQVEVQLFCTGISEWAIQVCAPEIEFPNQEDVLLFEPFGQVEKLFIRTEGKTGLSLSIVKALATAMGGRVQQESTPGRGCVFSVFLPIHTQVGE